MRGVIGVEGDLQSRVEGVNVRHGECGFWNGGDEVEGWRFGGLVDVSLV